MQSLRMQMAKGKVKMDKVQRNTRKLAGAMAEYIRLVWSVLCCCVVLLLFYESFLLFFSSFSSFSSFSCFRYVVYFRMFTDIIEKLKILYFDTFFSISVIFFYKIGSICSW